MARVEQFFYHSSFAQPVIGFNSSNMFTYTVAKPGISHLNLIPSPSSSLQNFAFVSVEFHWGQFQPSFPFYEDHFGFYFYFLFIAIRKMRNRVWGFLVATGGRLWLKTAANKFYMGADVSSAQTMSQLCGLCLFFFSCTITTGITTDCKTWSLKNQAATTAALIKVRYFGKMSSFMSLEVFQRLPLHICPPPLKK